MDAISTLPINPAHYSATNFVVPWIRSHMWPRQKKERTLYDWFEEQFGDIGFPMRSRQMTVETMLTQCAHRDIRVSPDAIEHVFRHSDFVTTDSGSERYMVAPADLFLDDGVYLNGLDDVLKDMPLAIPRPEMSFHLAIRLASEGIHVGYDQILVAHEPFAAQADKVGYRLMVAHQGRGRYSIEACQLLPNASLSSDWGILLVESEPREVYK